MYWRRRFGSTLAPGGAPNGPSEDDRHIDLDAVDFPAYDRDVPTPEVTFDTGRELLHAALDEVRSPGVALDPPRGTEEESVEDGLNLRRDWHAIVQDAVAEQLAVVDTPATEIPGFPADPGDREPRATRRQRRRRRIDLDELDEASIEELDSEPRPQRRRRRPPSGVAARADRTPQDEPMPEFPPLPSALAEREIPAAEREVRTGGSVHSRNRPTAHHAVTRDRRRLLLPAAAVAGVVALAAAVVAVSGGGGQNAVSPPNRPAVPTSARLVFDPETTPEGVRVERTWTLRGDRGNRFVGRLSFSNTTSAPLTATYQEVIPKSLASSVEDVTFDPKPVVVNPDPVVQYSFTEMPAGEVATARYEIQVPPDGADRARLEQWADDLDAEAAPPTTTTTSPAASGPGVGPTHSTPTQRGGTSGGSPAGNPGPPATNPPPPPPPATGTIVIRTVSRGGTGTFGYSGPGGNVSVTTSGSPNGVGQSGAMTVPIGRYSWTQVSLPPGWRLQGIDCTDRDAGPFEQRSTVSGATATFNVQAGETVVCTWTNQKT